MTSPASAAVRVSSGASLPLPPPGRRGATGFAVGQSVLLSTKNIALKTPGVKKLLPGAPEPKAPPPPPPASAAAATSAAASSPAPRCRCHRAPLLPPPSLPPAPQSVNSPLLVPQRLPEAGPSRFRSDSCSCWAAAARAADSPASNRKV